MKMYSRLLSFSGMIFLVTGTTLCAADRSAQDILNDAHKQIGSMDKYAFDAAVTDNDVDGSVIRHDIAVKVDRPGKLRVDTKGNLKTRSSYLNDGVYTMMDNGFGYYASVKTPKTIDAALDAIFKKYGIRAPLAQLVYSDMHKRVKFSNSKKFGKVMVGGVECDYIAVSDSEVEAHLWIASGDKPLLKAYKIFYKKEKNRPSTSATVTWVENPTIVESDFVFVAPKDAQPISVLNAE